jgi:hemoglobin
MTDATNGAVPTQPSPTVHPERTPPGPATPAIPTLYEWMGGQPALDRLMTLFYSRVPSDRLLGPVFAGMSAAHAEHVEKFVAEVLGGPPAYSAELGGAGGGHVRMIAHHLGRRLTEKHRTQWVRLLLECADEVGVPADPEFRSALVAYLEWGSRLAVINSQPGVAMPDPSPMPKWGWGVPGGPYVPPEDGS